MQTPKNPIRLLIVFLLVLAIVSLVTSNMAVITSPPNATAKNAPMGQLNSNPNLIWEKTYGGSGDDRAFYAANAEDGYMVVGSSTSAEQGKTAAWALRLNQDGNVLWNRTYSEDAGSEFRNVLSLDSGFLLVGNVFLPSGKVEGYVVKIDKAGTPQWNVTLQAREGVNKLFSASNTEQDFVLVGLSESADTGNSSVWLVKIDADGKVVWNRIYAGLGEAAGRAVTQTQDSSLMVAGYTDSAGNGNYDFLVLKVDLDGNVLWNRTYGGQQSDKAYAIAAAANGCVVAGDTRSKGAGDSDAYVIRIDLDGKLQWEQAVGGSGFDTPTCITPALDGGYLVGGITFSFGNGQRDFWLFKIDDAGKVMWSCTVGRSGYEEAYAVVKAGGNQYVMAGWTNSIAQGRYDFYVVKVEVNV